MADVVDPAGVVVAARGDEADEDEVILAPLVIAKADYLLTGDAALLALADRYPILPPAVFGNRHLR